MHGASERDLDFDPLAERFFSQLPAPWAIAREADDWQPKPLSAVQRMAMVTTAAPVMAMLAVGLSFLVSHPLLAASVSKAPRSRPLPALESILPESIAPRAPELPLLAAPAVPAVTRAADVVRVERPPAKVSRSSTFARREKAPSAAKRARQLLDAGDAAGARDRAREAVRSAPERAAGYIALAAALDKLGDRAGKAETFRRCAERATDALASACRALSR